MNYIKKYINLQMLFITILGTTLISMIIYVINSSASIIKNGDFISNYQYWQQYQDDSTYPNSTFFTIENSKNPYAKISIDIDINSNGITDTDASICDLYQKVDCYTTTGTTLTLSFDWLFNGVTTPNPNEDNDIFNVFFEDSSGNIYNAYGNPGYIYQTYNYSNTWKHFSTNINYYLNKSNYYLTFELLSSGNNKNNNFWQSNLCLDNISINIRSPINSVPEPISLLIFLPGLAIIFKYKKYIKI